VFYGHTYSFQNKTTMIKTNNQLKKSGCFDPKNYDVDYGGFSWNLLLAELNLWHELQEFEKSINNSF